MRRTPINVKFEIPYFTVSGIQVRYLKIVEKSGYQALRTCLLFKPEPILTQGCLYIMGPLYYPGTYSRAPVNNADLYRMASTTCVHKAKSRKLGLRTLRRRP